MRRRIHNYIIALVCLFSSIPFANAQQVKGTISAHGKQYQRIVLPHAYNSLIGNDIGKLRIKDKKGVEIPFILNNPPLDEKQFISIPFTKSQTDSSEIIIVDNANKDRINNYLLKIANTNAQKEYSIEGSNDQKDWFVLVNNAILSNLQHPTETSILTKIDFPLNDYSWIRIRFNSKNSSPINILNIGKIEITDLAQHYERLNNVSFTSKEDKKEKKTLLTIRKQGKSTFDIIRFHITNPSFYNRPTWIYGQQQIKSRNKTRTIQTDKYYFDLNNTNAQRIEIQNLSYSDTFFIAIQNDDNPSLQIDSITLYQKPITIVAYLDEKEGYSLEADTTWKTPTYDLEKLNIDLSKITHSATVTNIEVDSTQVADGNDDKNGNLILIISSIVGALLVFYFGFSLLKDMKKEDNS
ncbi:MAG TPA: hypothetical protein VK023_00640 [Sphingobacterium bovisgrunnientis]|nr:hypothetical protein [Sphingobacterium bovisgrunnientis]